MSWSSARFNFLFQTAQGCFSIDRTSMSVKETWKHLKVVYYICSKISQEWMKISIWRHWLKLAPFLQARTLDMKAGVYIYETIRLHVARSYRIKAHVYAVLITTAKRCLGDANFFINGNTNATDPSPTTWSDRWRIELDRLSWLSSTPMNAGRRPREGHWLLDDCRISPTSELVD